MIVFGVDPGLTATGYGVVRSEGNRIAPLNWGVIRSGGGELAQRLERLHARLGAAMRDAKPDVVAVEEVFLGKNPRSALLQGHARGVALLAAAQGGYAVREFPAAVIKQSVVGNGRAAKQQVNFMVGKLLGLGNARVPEDAADGLAAAICCILRTAVSRQPSAISNQQSAIKDD